MKKLIVACAAVGGFIWFLQAGEDDTSIVQFSACQDYRQGHIINTGDKSLFLRSNAPLTKGRTYELTYVLGKGAIIEARDVGPAECKAG